MKRILLTLLIVAGIFLASNAIATERLALKERDDWAGTYFKDRKLGFTHARVHREGDDVVVNTRVFFRLQAGGAEQSTIITQKTRLGSNLQLKDFSLLQEIMGNRQKVVGTLNGNSLSFGVTTRGYQKTKAMDYPKDVYPASTVWLNILDRGLKVGKKGTLRIFIEPFQMIMPMQYHIERKETVKHEGKTLEAYVIRQQYAGMDSSLWVTADGTLIVERTAHGFESRLEDETTARDLGPVAMTASNFITLSLVTPNRLIEDPDTVQSLTLNISNLKTPDALPNDQRQTILDVKPQPSGAYTARVKVKRSSSGPAVTAEMPVIQADARYLEETPEIQSRHGMIRALAKQLVGSETEAWKAALKINEWVNKSLEKVLVDSFTALDALHNRKGECQSHTNLFVAIARAAGIPARVVNGLVYSRQYKGFLYHAWPEVYVGEWRALDPTLGQSIVDATHIKLSEGNSEGALKLMEFLGRVQIDLVDG